MNTLKPDECPVCGELLTGPTFRNPAGHTVEGHYESPVSGIDPNKLKQWRAEALAKSPKLQARVGRRAEMTIRRQDHTIFKTVAGVFDHNGQDTQLRTDEGVYWEFFDNDWERLLRFEEDA